MAEHPGCSVYIFLSAGRASDRVERAAVEALVPHHEEGLCVSLPVGSLSPHERHRAQREAECLIDWKSIDRCVWPQFEVPAKEACASLLGRHAVLPARGRRRHDVAAELAEVIARLRDAEVIEV